MSAWNSAACASSLSSASTASTTPRMASSVSRRAAFSLVSALRPLRHLVRLSERRLVQANLGLFPLAFDGEIDGAIAARKLLLAKAARPDLERFEAGRETQAKIEIAAVDAARLPGPARVTVHAFGAGKAGHAFQGHGASLSLTRGKPARPLL